MPNMIFVQSSNNYWVRYLKPMKTHDRHTESPLLTQAYSPSLKMQKEPLNCKKLAPSRRAASGRFPLYAMLKFVVIL